MGNLKRYFLVLGLVGWTLALMLGCGKEKRPEASKPTIFGTWKEQIAFENGALSDSILRIEEGKITFTRVCHDPKYDRPLRANAVSPATIDESAKRIKITEKMLGSDIQQNRRCENENDPGEYSYKFSDDGALRLINRETGQVRTYSLVTQ